MTDTAPGVRGGFPDIKPAEHAPPGLGRFVTAMRRLQDLTLASNPDSSAWTAAPGTSKTPAHYWTATRCPRAWRRPAASSNCPAWATPAPAVDRYGIRADWRHHGGTLHPLACRRKQRRARRNDPAVLRLAVRDGGLYCRHSPTRTAYLHVDYRNITPIDEPLTAHGHITEIDGRKIFISATMTAADGTLLSEANGLMVRLLPHQP